MDGYQTLIPLYNDLQYFHLQQKDYHQVLHNKQLFDQKQTNQMQIPLHQCNFHLLNQCNHYIRLQDHPDHDIDYLSYIGVEKNGKYLKLKFANSGSELNKEEGDFNKKNVEKILHRLDAFDDFKKIPENVRDKLNNGWKEYMESILSNEYLDSETKLLIEEKIQNGGLNEEETQILESRLGLAKLLPE